MDYCTYETFNPNFLTNFKPDQKKPIVKPGEKGVPPYWIINLQYNLGTEDKPKFSEFKMEFCELYSAQGIIKSGYGKEESQPKNEKEIIRVYLNEDEEEQAKLIESLNTMYRRAAVLLGGVKGQVGKHKFNPDEPETLFNHPIWYPRDEATSELIPGKQGSMNLKLFQRGSGLNMDQTTFFETDGVTPIDKNILQGVRMRFIPLMAIKSIFIGAVTCLQMEMVQAIVTHIEARNSASNQMATIEKLKLKDPEGETRIKEQLAKLRMRNQNQFLAPPALTSDHNEGASEPTSTVAGIKPTSNESEEYENVQQMTKQAPKRTNFKIPNMNLN